ncbi:MAG: inositol monophosphatase family protein [Anaerolineales bacterium]
MYLELAVQAAQEAGRALRGRFRQPHEIILKGVRDITTEADLEAEALAIGVIRAGCPGALFVSEESNQTALQSATQPVWYIDPLDGTTNYARGLGGWCVSVAAALAGQVVCGAVFDPVTGELFTASRGEGAWLNGAPLHVSGQSELAESIILMDWPREQTWRKQGLRYLDRLAPRILVPRSVGSAALALCYVAAGWAEGYFQYTLKSWDVAAASLILAEAGARTTDMRGRPAQLDTPDWLASNGHIHEALLALGPLSPDAP